MNNLACYPSTFISYTALLAEMIIERFPKGSTIRICDIGAGYGNIAHLFLNKFNNIYDYKFEFYGLDTRPDSEITYKSLYKEFLKHELSPDTASLKTVENFVVSNKIDIVILFEVVEHFSKDLFNLFIPFINDIVSYTLISTPYKYYVDPYKYGHTLFCHPSLFLPSCFRYLKDTLSYTYCFEKKHLKNLRYIERPLIELNSNLNFNELGDSQNGITFEDVLDKFLTYFI